MHADELQTREHREEMEITVTRLMKCSVAVLTHREQPGLQLSPRTHGLAVAPWLTTSARVPEQLMTDLGFF